MLLNQVREHALEERQQVRSERDKLQSQVQVLQVLLWVPSSRANRRLALWCKDIDGDVHTYPGRLSWERLMPNKS
jgi:hypothetical protein